MRNLRGKERRRIHLERAGCLPEEAIAYSVSSAEALKKAPYLRYLIRSRRALKTNAKRWGWSDAEYRQAIRNKYADAKAIKADGSLDPWAYLRDLDERFRRWGFEYESPWQKRIRRKGEKKREVKRVTRQATLESWVAELDTTIARTTNEYRLEKLREQRENLQKQLDKIKEEKAEGGQSSYLGTWTGA